MDFLDTHRKRRDTKQVLVLHRNCYFSEISDHTTQRENCVQSDSKIKIFQNFPKIIACPFCGCCPKMRACIEKVDMSIRTLFNAVLDAVNNSNKGKCVEMFLLKHLHQHIQTYLL